MTWTVEPSEEYARRRRQYEKKHARELAAVEKNLNTYLAALNAGNKPLQIKFGFVHTKYDRGVASLDQKGGGGNLAQTRLYIYPDVDHRVLWLLTLGDKNSQKADVQLCYALVAGFEKETTDGAEQGEGGTDQAGEEGPVQDDRGYGARAFRKRDVG